MNATESVIELLAEGSPPQSALDAAAADLERFAADAATGESHAAVTALKGALSAPAGQIALAWTRGTAAATATEPVRWVPVCAAVSALGDAEPQSAALEATATGYAVADSVAAALGEAHALAGWSAPSTAGVVGATAAAARLLGLDADRARHAIGIGATQAAGLRLAEGSDAGALQLGKAAANAVEAALLAQHGFTAAADPLSGRRGLFALMGAAAEPEFELPVSAWREAGAQN